MLGDLGWDPFAVRAGWQVVSLWTRAARMPMEELLKKALIVQRHLLANRKSCWLMRVEDILKQSSFGMKVWKEWYESIPSRIHECVTREQIREQREVQIIP